MTGRHITFDLQIENESIRDEVGTFLASQVAYRQHHAEDPGFPDLIVLELGDDQGKAFALVHSILSTSPVSEIFLTSSRTEPAVLLEALRAGVKEFIPQPLDREELQRALERFEGRHKNGTVPQSKPGQLINVLGSKGGVGATTVAVNLAMQLQRAHQDGSVVLVDLNSQFGDTALFLDIEPTHTLGDIAANIARLDQTFLMGVLSKHPSGLYLLPAAHNADAMGSLTPESLEKTLELLQTLFDYVVLDSGHLFDEITMTTLERSSILLLVCTLTLPVLRNTKRCVDLLANIGYPEDNIKFVINRHKSKNEISLQDFEESLKHKPFCTIPNDYYTALQAINNGEPIYDIDSRAKITKSFKNMAMHFLKDRDHSSKKRGATWFGKMFF